MNLNAMRERELCPWGVERATGCAGWVCAMYDDLPRLTPAFCDAFVRAPLSFVMCKKKRSKGIDQCLVFEPTCADLKR